MTQETKKEADSVLSEAGGPGPPCMSGAWTSAWGGEGEPELWGGDSPPPPSASGAGERAVTWPPWRWSGLPGLPRRKVPGDPVAPSTLLPGLWVSMDRRPHRCGSGTGSHGPRCSRGDVLGASAYAGGALRQLLPERPRWGPTARAPLQSGLHSGPGTSGWAFRADPGFVSTSSSFSGYETGQPVLGSVSQPQA